jgi:hypothetical protein
MNPADDDREPRLDPASDPTRMGNQASLTTATGTSWLVVGGLMAAISVVLLLALQQVDSSGVALLGVVIIVLAYLVMVEARLLMRTLRTRLIVMATFFGVIAASALVFVILIAFSAAR